MLGITRWPVKVGIFEERSNGGYRFSMTKARRNQKKNCYELKKGGEMPQIKKQHLSPNNWLMLYSTGPGEFTPMNVKGAEIEAIPSDIRDWQMVREMRSKEEWKKAWWKEWAPYIAMGAMGLLFGIGIWLSFEKIIALQSIGADLLPKATDALKANTETMEAVLRILERVR